MLPRRHALLLRMVFFIALLYMFFVSIRLMGTSFKLFGKGFAETLIYGTANPFVGLFAGILATSIVQSSSSTTSIVVGLVASGTMSIANAVPIIIGANIGTTVTNILVSLAHIHRRNEFERAFAGATCHDFFNLLSVVVLLPLQLNFHILEKLASLLTNLFVRSGGIHIANPLKLVTEPVVDALTHTCFHKPIAMLGVAFVLLFLSLRFFTRHMRALVATRVEKNLNEYVFNNASKAFVMGASLTAIIQSSSVSTSLVVPLVGAGILTVEAIYPYTLGTNIGTTVTGILASLATASPAAVTIALCHTVFNLLGIALFYPLRWIPIGLAKELGRTVAHKRVYAIIFVLGTFYMIPLLLIFLFR
jgi:sodium-dependent phosphate cotransporter